MVVELSPVNKSGEVIQGFKPAHPNGPESRDNTIDIIKGIGIILMVVGHSGAPEWLVNVICAFHMPLFFIASGWFFREQNLDCCTGFAKRKLKGIYLPYLKWCIFFLLFHNLFFRLGVLNDSYGAIGEVSYRYTAKDIVSNAIHFTFLMTAYEPYLLGAYWFIRALLWGSLLLCFTAALLFKVIKWNKRTCILVAAGMFGILGGVLSYFKYHIPYWPQGGYREMMAAFFIGIGFMIRSHNWWRTSVWLLISMASIPISLLITPTSLNPNPTFMMWFVIVFTGLTGYIIVYHFSKMILYVKPVAAILAKIGINSFYVMTFHFLMFKPASLLKAYLLGLDLKMIGCHPVIPPEGDQWYWIVYSVSSLIFSLLLARLVRCIPSVNRMVQKMGLPLKRRF